MANRTIHGNKSWHFFSVGDWTYQNMPRRYVATYACVLAMQRAGMSCSAPEIARRIRRSEDTIRTHFREIRRLELWAPQARFRCGARISNTYLFRRLPEMPAAIAAEPFVVASLGGDPQAARDTPRALERGPVLENRTGAGADCDEPPLAQSAGHKRIGKDQETDNSHRADEQHLPLPLRAALSRALAGDVRPCLRALQQETSKLAPEVAKRVRIEVLNQLCDAAQRGTVRKAPALTRTIARATINHRESDPPPSVNLASVDAALAQALSPYTVRKAALERARHWLDCDGLTSDPALAAPELPGERGRIVGAMVIAQVAFLRATRSDSGLERNEASTRLDALEEELRRMITTDHEAAK